MSVHVFHGIPPAFGDVPLPQLGPTGSRVVTARVTVRQPLHEIHYLEPGPPSRQVSTWDDDDVEHVRELSDEEFASAQANYEKRHAEWARTCGTVYMRGPIEMTMTGECEDGCSFEAMHTGEEWRFTGWKTGAPPPKMPTLFAELTFGGD